MKSSVEKVSNLERKLSVQIPAALVQSAFEQKFKGVQKQANIKGFRQGKAPLATIKNLYGSQIKQDVAQDLIQKHYFTAVQEHSLEPINYPEFEFDSLEEDKDFSFSALFEIKPEINLKSYEGIAIEKEKIDVGDEKINQVLENIRGARAELVDVLETRPAQLGDVAIIDFKGFVDGQPLENGAGTDHNLELGAKQFIEGFEDGIIGMTVGGNKTLSLSFPTPYHAAELAGKTVEFQVTLKGLKKKALPELNDEFVQKLMGSNPGLAQDENAPHSVESLKKTIIDDLSQSEQKRIETDLKNRLLKKLVSLNPTEVPPSMLKEQKQLLIEDTKKRMKEQGMGDIEFEAYVQKWDKDFDASAADMIQSGFIIDAIAKKHDLNWKQEDLDKKFTEYAIQTGIDKARIVEFYSRPEQMNRLTYSITEDKVIAFLLSSAKVSEVPAAKLKESLG